jgi:hypothetical protein
MQVVERMFMKKWGFVVVDLNVTKKQMLQLRCEDFVRIHLLQKSDTMQTLSLRYNVHDLDIRVLNNLLSERALSAHQAVYVPVNDKSYLIGKQLSIQRSGGMSRILPVRSWLGLKDPSFSIHWASL